MEYHFGKSVYRKKEVERKRANVLQVKTFLSSTWFPWALSVHDLDSP